MFSTITLAYVDNNENTDIEEILPCEYLQSTHGSDCTNVIGPNYVPSEQMQLDVVFVVDSTGSMHDEIRTVKEELTNIVQKINSGYPRPDVRVGVVTYRDYKPYENEYLTKQKDLTRNTQSVVNFIGNIEANGGGDYEEAVEAGLDRAINKMDWRRSAHRIIILVGDASARNTPYQSYEEYGNYPEHHDLYNWKNAVDDANDKEIRIYTASGSGMNKEGLNQWRTIAKKTGGSYIKLFYERRIIEDYYVERDISPIFATEARASRSYEATTDSIMTNNFGFFAEKSLMQVAEDSGVEYEDSLDDITGEIIKEPTNTQIKSFFREIFSKLQFWK